ncbi:hypothetical protein I5803_03550 [Caenimonas sp. DR4.4]|uniref:Uncharacterized protein n=1 Tax=Caenimonas aquaedulcis TaxID=2793270 RepID=A0A931H217_9BURK|nr:hypothetical protein [Caenimonas aquaedulcis]
MGITMLTLGGLFAPLQALVAWLAPSRPAEPRGHAPARAATANAAVAHAPARRVPPLRVVRLVESPCGPAAAGRMFMSGRMADVCAELDRLAALEAAAG